MIKYYIAFFLLTGFIDDNNQLHYCNQPNDHICCKDISLYKSTMKCTNYKDCTYLTITNMISNMTLTLEVVKSTIKGGLFNKPTPGTPKPTTPPRTMPDAPTQTGLGLSLDGIGDTNIGYPDIG